MRHQMATLIRVLYTNYTNKSHQIVIVWRHCLGHLTVTPLTARNEAKYWSILAIFLYLTFIRCPYLNILQFTQNMRDNGNSKWMWTDLLEAPSEYCDNILYGKTSMMWLLMLKKNWGRDYSFWHNTRTWRTDRRMDTAQRHKLHLFIALHGKMINIYIYIYDAVVATCACFFFASAFWWSWRSSEWRGSVKLSWRTGSWEEHCKPQKFVDLFLTWTLYFWLTFGDSILWLSNIILLIW